MPCSHGAKQSTPTSLLDHLEPGVLLASNPHNTSFMHPCKCALQKPLSAASLFLGGCLGALGSEW
jgi:beta-lactamase superfamily II metal-dependent hydrolase